MAAKNLLYDENARRALERGVNKVADAVKVTVADEGPGIPREEREEIFEAFRQIDRKDATHGKGAGLGLAICKGIIESHGGRIWIADSAIGTTVAFTLPLAISVNKN